MLKTKMILLAVVGGLGLFLTVTGIKADDHEDDSWWDYYDHNCSHPSRGYDYSYANDYDCYFMPSSYSNPYYGPWYPESYYNGGGGYGGYGGYDGYASYSGYGRYDNYYGYGGYGGGYYGYYPSTYYADPFYYKKYDKNYYQKHQMEYYLRRSAGYRGGR